MSALDDFLPPVDQVNSARTGLGSPNIGRYSELRTKQLVARPVHDLSYVVPDTAFGPGNADAWTSLVILNGRLPFAQTLVVRVFDADDDFATTDQLTIHVNGYNQFLEARPERTPLLSLEALAPGAGTREEFIYLSQVYGHVLSVDIKMNAALAGKSPSVSVGISNDWVYADDADTVHVFENNHGIGLPWRTPSGITQPFAEADVICAMLERTNGVAFVATLPTTHFGTGRNASAQWSGEPHKLWLDGTAIPTHPASGAGTESIVATDRIILNMQGMMPEPTQIDVGSNPSYLT